MKPIFLLATICLLSLHSCSLSQETITGNGNVITKNVPVESFSGLDLKCKCDVEIVQSENESVTIIADENLHEYVDIRNNGDLLIIKTPDDIQFRRFEKFIIRVSIKNLTSFKNSGVGNVKSINTLKLENLDLQNSSVGNNNFDLEVTQIEINNSAVGNTTITGKAKQASIKNSAVGNLNLKDFVTNILHVNNSAIGNIHVFATDEIYIQHSGIGNFSYSGNAVVKQMNISGIGKAIKK